MAIGSLYLIPSLLSESSDLSTIPEIVINTVQKLEVFLVEDEKSARRFIKLCCPQKIIQELKLFRLNEHTKKEELTELLSPLLQGLDIGIISESGCPVIADPGTLITRDAHKIGAKVIPLPGPSSVLLAIMASGLSGQKFTFHGYLPIKHDERTNYIHAIQKKVLSDDETHVFIETPYRNNKLLSELIQICDEDLFLSVAIDLLGREQEILAFSIKQWLEKRVELKKLPTTFVLGNQ